MTAAPDHSPAPPAPTVLPSSGAAWAERWYGPLLILVCAAALCLRSAQLSEYLNLNPTATAPWQDGAVYWEWAARIATGQFQEATPFLAAPLYPYFLAAIRAAGGEFFAVYLAQLALHLLTGALIASATRIRAGEGAGLLAACFFFALSEPASFVLRILPNTLQLLLVAALWRTLAPLGGDLRRRGTSVAAGPLPISIGRGSAAGALVGLLALAMPQAQLLLPALAAWLAWPRSGRRDRASLLRRGLAAGAACLLAGALLILPATWHNHRVSGEFIPITAHSGITLQQGNSPASHGVYTTIAGVSANRDKMHADAARVYAEATGRPGTWGQIDAFFRARVIAYWQAQPVAAAELFSKKLWWFLTSWRYDDQYPVVLEREIGVADRAVLAPLQTPWLIGLAAAGLIAALRSPGRRGPEWLLIGLALLTTLVFFYTPRYRLCALPPLCGLAAYALFCVRSLPLPIAVTVALAVAPLAGELINKELFRIRAGGKSYAFDGAEIMRDPYRRVMAGTMVTRGDRALQGGETVAAKEWYARARSVDRENAAALRNLGALLLENGEEGGVLLLRESLVFDPDDAATQLRLYNVTAPRGKLLEAADYLNRVLERDPQNVEALLARSWMAATSEQPLLRNTITATEMAGRALSLAGPAADERADFLDVSAAAAAARGDFEAARREAQRAVEIAEKSGQRALAAEIQERRDGYAADQVWIGPPRLVRLPPLAPAHSTN